MRWYVEITAIGEGSPSNKLCLEAAHWQPALQKARQIRGEDEKLAGVSVEFLDNGCKAVDAGLRLVYEVSQAPDDAPIVDRGKLAAADAPKERPSRRGRRRKKKRKVRSSSELAGAGKAKKTMVLGSRGGAEVREQPLSNTLSFGSPGEANVEPPGVLAPPDPDVPPVPAERPKRTTDRPAPAPQPTKVDADATPLEGEPVKGEPAPVEQETAPVEQETGPVEQETGPVEQPAKAAHRKTEPKTEEDPSSAQQKAEQKAEQKAAEDEAAQIVDVGQKMLSTEDTKPSVGMPLHHREQVHSVALPQPLAKLEEFALALISEAVRDLASLPAGKVVSLALFDHRFKNEPKRAPILTARWADWRAQPRVVFFPYADSPATSAAEAVALIGGTMLKPGAAPPPAKRPEGKPAAAGPAEAKPDLPSDKAAERKLASEERGPKTKRPGVKSEERGPTTKRPVAKSESVAKTTKKSAERPQADVSPSRASSRKASAASGGKGETKRALMGGAGPSSADVPAPRRSRRSLGARAAKKDSKKDSKKNDTLSSRGANDNGSSARASSPGRRVRLGAGLRERAQVVTPPEPLEEEPLTRDEREQRMAAARERATGLAPPQSVPGARIVGEDLLTDLFEEIAGLHYLTDALAGAGFVLELALEKLPSEVGLVSLFDLDKREYVVVRQTGGAKSALLLRVGERASVPRRAMRSNRSVVLSDIKSDSLEGDHRWQEIEVLPRSLICAPVTKGGRYLGLIELANPHDGKTFHDSDGHALTYIGQQFGEFLANRGVILDPDAVVASAKAAGHR